MHLPGVRVTVLYTTIDLKLWNKIHGPVHFEIGVTCVFNGYVLHVVITRPSNTYICKFIRLCSAPCVNEGQVNVPMQCISISVGS